jgi:hypothetical protein
MFCFGSEQGNWLNWIYTGSVACLSASACLVAYKLGYNSANKSIENLKTRLSALETPNIYQATQAMVPASKLQILEKEIIKIQQFLEEVTHKEDAPRAIVNNRLHSLEQKNIETQQALDIIDHKQDLALQRSCAKYDSAMKQLTDNFASMSLEFNSFRSELENNSTNNTSQHSLNLSKINTLQTELAQLKNEILEIRLNVNQDTENHFYTKQSLESLSGLIQMHDNEMKNLRENEMKNLRESVHCQHEFLEAHHNRVEAQSKQLSHMFSFMDHVKKILEEQKKHLVRIDSDLQAREELLTSPIKAPSDTIDSTQTAAVGLAKLAYNKILKIEDEQGKKITELEINIAMLNQLQNQSTEIQISNSQELKKLSSKFKELQKTLQSKETIFKKSLGDLEKKLTKNAPLVIKSIVQEEMKKNQWIRIIPTDCSTLVKRT